MNFIKNQTKTCCFIGHRKIEITENLKQNINQEEHLILRETKQWLTKAIIAYFIIMKTICHHKEKMQREIYLNINQNLERHLDIIMQNKRKKLFIIFLNKKTGGNFSILPVFYLLNFTPSSNTVHHLNKVFFHHFEL